MPTKLYYHGTDGVDAFVDAENNTVYHPSDRPHDVPDDRVEWFLSHDGWEPADSEVSGVGEGTVDDTVRVMPSEPVEPDEDSDTDSDADTDVEASEEETAADADTADDVESVDDEEQPDDEFDAAEFIDGHSQTVSSRIRQGAVDDHLDAVEAAERDRESSPREGSVIKAINARRAVIDSDGED